MEILFLLNNASDAVALDTGRHSEFAQKIIALAHPEHAEPMTRTGFEKYRRAFDPLPKCAASQESVNTVRRISGERWAR